MNQPAYRHPQGLPYLFLTELWERFGFYVVQGLLVLYTTEYLGFSDNQSYTIQGVFTALVYSSPLIGGYVANRLLGFKTSVVWGGFFLIAGYFLLALPSTNQNLFYPALAIIIVGNGLFKPNISSLLGAQYEPHDQHRDAGFTLFYIGINIGALLAGLSSGYIKEYLGWHMSFALSSIGLIIGLLTFFYGLKYIKESEKPPSDILSKIAIFGACLVAIGGIHAVLRIELLAKWLLPCVGVVLLFYLSVLTFKQSAEYRQKMMILMTLVISSIMFWVLFLQAFLSVNLFVDRLVDKQFLGLPLTTTVFYASESIFIIILGPLFAWIWQRLSNQNRNPSPIHKFIGGLFFAGLGFLLLSQSTYFSNAQGLIPAIWVFAAYFIITIGELLLSPIGLSAVTTLAPAHLVGFMMGVWFIGTGFGGMFAGLAAKLASIPENVTSSIEKLAIYHQAFFYYACMAFVVAGLLWLMSYLLHKTK